MTDDEIAAILARAADPSCSAMPDRPEDTAASRDAAGRCVVG